MEEEQRKKKLEAGKERLAAFRKKKMIKKKKRPMSDVNLTDASSCSDVQSLTGDSDQGSLGYSGEDFSAEECDLHSAVFYQTKLVAAKQRMSELEETVEGKQLALDNVLQENRQLKDQQNSEHPVSKEVNVDNSGTGSNTKVNRGDFQAALAQRDAIIQQLTARLRTAARTAQHDYTSETQTLAHQVALLQQQLQQAGETVQGQLNQHSSSSQALQEAKAEILSLQTLLNEKEEFLGRVSQKAQEAGRLEKLCAEQQLRETTLQANITELLTSVGRYEARTKDLESSVGQYEARTKDLESSVESYESRQKELLVSVQQHEAQQTDLQLYVQQAAGKEATLVESVSSLEAQLAVAVRDKEELVATMQSSGQDEQSKLAKLTLELQNLGQENENLVSELMSVKKRNVDLEKLCRQIDELQSECTVKQSENDELRNKINDQQGEMLSLGTQIDTFIQDGDQGQRDLDVLHELMDTKDKLHEADIQEKNSLIQRLEDDMKRFQEERGQHVSTVESLNVQILTLQSDLTTSVCECDNYKTQSTRYRSWLQKLGKNVDVDVEDGSDDEVDAADSFAVESELEVRRVGTTAQKTVDIGEHVDSCMSLNTGELKRRDHVNDVEIGSGDSSQRTDCDQSLLLNNSVPHSGVTETGLQLQTIQEELGKMQDVCMEHLKTISDLESRNACLEEEVTVARSQMDEANVRMVDITNQNCILVDENSDLCSQLQSLSSELQINISKLKESEQKYNLLSARLLQQVEENTSTVSKLTRAEEDVKKIRDKLDDTELKLETFEEETDKLKAELHNQVLDYQSLLGVLQQAKDAFEQQDSTASAAVHANVERLEKSLAECTTELDEVKLCAGKTSESLQNQCDQYASEAATLQEQLATVKGHLECDQGEERLKWSTKVSTLEEELEALRTELNDMIKTVDKTKEEHETLSILHNKTTSEYDSLKQQLYEANNELTIQHAKSDGLQQEILTVECELAKHVEIVQEKEEKIHVLQDQLDSHSAALADSQSQKDILLGELASSRQELLSVSSKARNMQDKVQQSYEETIASLKLENTDAQIALSELKKTSEDDNASLTEALTEKEQTIITLKSDLETLLAETSQTAAEQENTTKDVIAKMKNEIDQYRQTIEDLASEVARAKENTKKELAEKETIVASQQNELEQTYVKLKELTLGAEENQTELQFKCNDQAGDIARLTSERDGVRKELQGIQAEMEESRKQSQTEIGSLQQSLQQLRSEYERNISEEKHIKSEVKSKLDMATYEVTHLQDMVDAAREESESLKKELETVKSDREAQLEGSMSCTEAVRSECRELRTEMDQLRITSQAQRDAKVQVQTQYEKCLNEVQALETRLKCRGEELDAERNRNDSLQESMNTEQAARLEFQTRLESTSAEFDRVSASERTLQEDAANHAQKLDQLIALIKCTNSVIDDGNISSVEDGFNVLEQSLNNVKIELEEQSARTDILTAEISDLSSTNQDLNSSLHMVSHTEGALKLEIEQLKAELEMSSTQLSHFAVEMKHQQTLVDGLQEEKEILKANFDCCMVEMQQKLLDQENQGRHLQSQLMESAKDKERDSTEVKEMYEAHIAEVEEKLLRADSELMQAKRAIAEHAEAKKAYQEACSNKIVQMEDNLSSMESENSRLHDRISKLNENFAIEREDMKSIFESQIAVLEDNCKSLESTMFKRQHQLNETAKSHEHEKLDLEKDFDIQLSELEDNCRILEMDNGKLKRQMDEMARDFVSEKGELKRMYENQIFDLEERCSQSFFSANKSIQQVNDISSDFGKEREDLEAKLHALEQRCLQLEHSRADAEQRLELVTESAQHERKCLQESLSGQVKEIQRKYEVMEIEQEALKEVLEQKEQTHKQEIETLKSEQNRKIEMLEEKYIEVTSNNYYPEVHKEPLQKSTAASSQETAEIEQLSLQNASLENMLKEAADNLQDMEVLHKQEIESFKLKIDTLTASACEDSNVSCVQEQIDKLKSDLRKEKLKAKASKQSTEKYRQSLDKYKKELQNQKASSEKDIHSLRLRLEAWEVELIERRHFVEQDKPEATSQLEMLRKKDQQKVDDLSSELKQLKTDYVAKQEGFEPIDDPPVIDAFEPEPDIHEMMTDQSGYLLHSESSGNGVDIPVIGFHPEVSLGGFMPETEHTTTMNQDQHSHSTIQIVSQSSQQDEVLITGDGFQPEVEDSKIDTFLPESPDRLHPLEARSVLPSSTTHKPTCTTATQTEETTESLHSSETKEAPEHSAETPPCETPDPEDADLLRRQHQHDKDMLEEEFTQKMRRQEAEMQVEHRAAMAAHQKDVETKTRQKLAALRLEKQQAFVTALKTARKQLEKKHKQELEKVRREMSAGVAAGEAAGEGDSSQLVKQLQQDNQELAEARDMLLQEIYRYAQNKTEMGDSERSRALSANADMNDERGDSDQVHSQKFVEELQSLSQRSVSDLPLEWELSVSTDDGKFELDENGLCVRQECANLRQNYKKLVELNQQFRPQDNTDNVFIEEVSSDSNTAPVHARRNRVDSSEHGRVDSTEHDRVDSTEHGRVDSSEHGRVDSSEHGSETGSHQDGAEAGLVFPDMSEADFEDSFRDKIQTLETENIALEKKLCDQLERFSVEKQQLELRCEQLQSSLHRTATSSQEVEDRLHIHKEKLEVSLHQLKEQFTETPETIEHLVQANQGHTASSESSRLSVETQTELSGDIAVMNTNDPSFYAASENVFTIEKAGGESLEGATSNTSYPPSGRKSARTELIFDDGAIPIIDNSEISATSSPKKVVSLPSIDHVEQKFFPDSEIQLRSPTGRTAVKRKKESFEISFNTTSLVSMTQMEGGMSINQEQMELTGTVSSSGFIVPEDYGKVALEIHHSEMMEEISRLKKDLYDAKATYARENAMLKEEVEREKTARQLWLEMKVPDEKLIKSLPLQTDVLELRQEVALLKENNRLVSDDNKQLMDRIREKECLMLQFRDKFDMPSIAEGECHHGADTQLLILQKQRDELLEEMEDFHAEHERMLTVLDSRTAMEETLRREKHALLERLVQYEDVQNVSGQNRSELEFLRGEQRRLEQLVLMKDDNEKQLLKQKRLLEEELYEIEGRLSEREAFLEEEKYRLLKEVKEKGLTILKLETMTSGPECPGGPRKPGRRASTGHMVTDQPPAALLPVLDTSYNEAIEILRNKLQLQYEVKESDLNQQLAGEKAALWQQHNKKVP